MLTIDKLKTQEALQGLTDAQLQHIATMSQADERTVIAEKVAEIHTHYDQDIEAITGIKKPDGVKTYDNLKTILQDQKQKLSTLQAAADKVGDLEAQIGTLKEQLKKGGGEATAAQISKLERDLSDERSRVSTLKDQLKAAQDAAAAEKQAAAAQLQQSTLKALWAADLSQVTPKKGLEDLFQETIDRRMNDFFANTSIEQEQGTSGTSYRFRREGKLLENEQGLTPYTHKDILHKEILKGLVQETPGGGGGAGGGGRPGGSGGAFNGGWKTQVEADNAIREKLISDGIGVTHPDHNTKLKEIRAEHKVSELPLR